MNQRTSDIVLKSIAVLAVLFGVLTVFSGGRTLFGDDGVREAAGAIVPFVLWFNFIAGFAYVLAGVGLWRRRRASVLLAIGITVATVAVFAAFWAHVQGGGAYEMRTVVAMTLRALFWAGVAMMGWRTVWRRA